MNKKILTTGALWAYGLACVATNQKDQECKNVLANPVQTQAPVVIQEENVRYLKTENGIKKLHRVIDETEEPSIKPTKKPVVSKKNNASEHIIGTYSGKYLIISHSVKCGDLMNQIINHRIRIQSEPVGVKGF